jgi:hypothetical protein
MQQARRWFPAWTTICVVVGTDVDRVQRELAAQLGMEPLERAGSERAPGQLGLVGHDNEEEAVILQRSAGGQGLWEHDQL